MSGPRSAALECRGVSRSFGDIAAVADLDLSVDAGEVLALVGFNGSGKTTLMRLILGMRRLDSGQVRILGSDAARATSQLWRRVGHFVETPAAYPELTVRENLWAAARLHGVPHPQAGTAVDAVVDRLALDPWVDRRAGTLSLGNRQRVGLAAALVHRPQLLILDEPTNALDPAGVVLLRDIVRHVAAAGAAVLVSSHHLDEVARVADRVAVLHRGRLLDELSSHHGDLERAFFTLAYDADVRSGLAPARPAGETRPW